MEFRTLIIALQKLYSGIFLRALQNRKGLGGHRKKRQYKGDVASPLHDYIDKISERARGENNPAPAVDEPTGSPEARDSHQPDGSGDTMEKGSSPALKSYFENRKAATMIVPEIGKKLRESAWTHLHEAIRYSRKGDRVNARMHADLADGTLREAVQYMSRKDFEALLLDIKSRFDEVLEDTGK